MPALYAQQNWCVRNGRGSSLRACCGRSSLSEWCAPTRCGKASLRGTSGEYSVIFTHVTVRQRKNEHSRPALFAREKYLFKNRTAEVPPNSYYHSLYPKIIQDIEVSPSEEYLGINWAVCAFLQLLLVHHQSFCKCPCLCGPNKTEA